MDEFLRTIDVKRRVKKNCAACPEDKPTEFLAQSGEIWCKKCRAKVGKINTFNYTLNYSGD